jgi:hypothetical protein
MSLELWGEVSMGACGHLPHIVNLVHFVVESFALITALNKEFWRH